MADSMDGYCATSKSGFHERKAIGYEKLTEDGYLQERVNGQTRYYVVWVCDACARTWWIEDHRPIGGPG